MSYKLYAEVLLNMETATRKSFNDMIGQFEKKRFADPSSS